MTFPMTREAITVPAAWDSYSSFITSCPFCLLWRMWSFRFWFRASARSRSMELLDLVGLTERAQHLPGELSGGQRQRVTIARALVNQPSIVWADEPTGDLDSETASEIMDLMCRLNEENGQSFVLVTHAADVGNRAHRIVRMRDGSIVDDGNGQSSGE